MTKASPYVRSLGAFLIGLTVTVALLGLLALISGLSVDVRRAIALGVGYAVILFVLRPNRREFHLRILSAGTLFGITVYIIMRYFRPLFE